MLYRAGKEWTVLRSPLFTLRWKSATGARMEALVCFATCGARRGRRTYRVPRLPRAWAWAASFTCLIRFYALRGTRAATHGVALRGGRATLLHRARQHRTLRALAALRASGRACALSLTRRRDVHFRFGWTTWTRVASQDVAGTRWTVYHLRI